MFNSVSHFTWRCLGFTSRIIGRYCLEVPTLGAYWTRESQANNLNAQGRSNAIAGTKTELPFAAWNRLAFCSVVDVSLESVKCWSSAFIVDASRP